MKLFLCIAFLNAFTDIGHKIVLHNAIYKHYDGSTQMALAAIINALILLPFVMTFSPAGFLSDKYSKKKIIQTSALLSIPITLLITLTYGFGLFQLAFAATFLLALQSAIYGPAKYGYIQELVGSRKLPAGIGAVQAVTIVAILSSSVLYSAGFEFLYASHISGPGHALTFMVPLGGLMVLSCLVEWVLSFSIRDTSVFKTSLKFNPGKYFSGAYLKANLRDIFKSKTISLCMLGLSIFWAVNQVILASFPAFFKETTGINNVMIAQGVAALAGIGIITGCLWAGKHPEKFTRAGPVLFSGFGMALCLLGLPFLTEVWSMSLLIMVYGFFGGCYLVPLNTILQLNSPVHSLGRMLAGKNFLQNLLMLLFLCGSLLFAVLEIRLTLIFFLLAGILSATLFWLKIKQRYFSIPEKQG